MVLRKNLLFLLLPVLVTGCYSYKLFPKSYRNFKTPAATETVYIINPELKKEFEILKSSGIYNITNDSTAAIKIKLQPMKNHFVCGQPLVGSMVTLGQIPAYLPDEYLFKYEAQEGSIVRSFSYELKVAKRFWFWDMFTFQKDFKKQAGKALAGNHYAGNLVVKQTP